MDKTLLKNIFIVAVIVMLIGGLVTCAAVNREKISELFVQKNADFYNQPSPKNNDVPEITEEPTIEPIEEPTEAPETPVQTAEAENEETPMPTSTLEPTPCFTVGHGEESEAPIIEIQETIDWEIEEGQQEPGDGQEQTAEGTPVTDEKTFPPLVITITKQSGSAAVYSKELVEQAGKVVYISRFIKRNTYTFTIKFMKPGKTQIAFIYDNGRFSLPTYFYIYDIVATEEGEVKGTLVGEYAYSASENKYMDVKDKYVYVYEGTIANILNGFGVKLVMPTPTPTPKPTEDNKPTPTPKSESIVKGAVEYINYIENAPTSEWVMSDEYNKEVFEISSFIETRFDKSKLFQFAVKSLDNPGYTNVCFAHYISVNGMMLLDELNVYKITLNENGRIDIENLVTIQRNEDETFGDLGFVVNQILEQYNLPEQKPILES